MGNNSVRKFIFSLSRFPVYRGSVLGRFYCIMLYREISLMVLRTIQKTYTHYVGRTWKFLMLKLVVHMVTTRLVFSWFDSPSGPRSPHCRGFDFTLRHTIFGLIPPDLCLITHNTNDSMPPAGFETKFPARQRLQTHTLNCAATGIGNHRSLRG
jgi:hypothetical protein